MGGFGVNGQVDNEINKNGILGGFGVNGQVDNEMKQNSILNNFGGDNQANNEIRKMNDKEYATWLSGFMISTHFKQTKTAELPKSNNRRPGFKTVHVSKNQRTLLLEHQKKFK